MDFPLDPDRSFPTTPQEITDGELVRVLGMALHGCVHWCAELHVVEEEPIPDALTPQQARALRGDPTDTDTGPTLQELTMLGATWVLVPHDAAYPPTVMARCRMREAVVLISCHEAARGALALGDSGTLHLDARQADAALQLALFGDILFGQAVHWGLRPLPHHGRGGSSDENATLAARQGAPVFPRRAEDRTGEWVQEIGRPVRSGADALLPSSLVIRHFNGGLVPTW